MKISLQWRLAGFAFVIFAILFIVFSDQLAYVLDASGLSGRTPAEDVPDEPVEATQKKNDDIPVGTRLKTESSPPWNRLYVPLAKSPLTIDGKSDDWCMLNGRFLCNDCIKENSTLSAWMHTMFDDQYFYLFSRVRQPDGLKSGVPVIDKLDTAEFIQARMRTDQATAINVWRNAEGKGVVQLHYYMPSRYPRPQVEKRTKLFADEDASHKLDGLANGVKLKIMEHPDQNGVDFECAVPWSLLCLDVESRPKPDSFHKMAFAAQLKSGEPIHVLQLKSDHRRALFHTFFSSKEPPWPPQVEVALTDGIVTDENAERRLFKVALNKARNQLEVDWSKPYHPETAGASELLVTPVTTPVIIDGDDDEWPKTAEVLIAERLSHEEGVVKLKAAADAENFYVHAKIYDLTPEGYGNSLRLRLKADKIRTITVDMKSLTVDEADALAKGAKVASKISASHMDYSLEAVIPWKLVTEDGKKPTSFAITGYASLNPVWSTASLTGTEQVTVEDGSQEWWVSARTIDTVPDSPGPIVFANRMVYDLRAGIPEKMSYFGGLAARFPWGTWSPEIDVIPGTPTVDGGIDDWDLSGGIFLCPDLHYYANNNALWLHAMYDADNLYLLYRFIDNTPMSNPSMKHYRYDDMAEISMSNGDELVRCATAAMESGETLVDVTVGSSKQSNPLLASYVKTAYNKHADGSGYVLEVAIPWSTFGGPRKAGDRETFYVLAKTTARMSVNGPTKFASTNDASDLPEMFGTANFCEKGPITPRPCRLVNGNTLPVVMRNGKPELDLSKLK